MSAPPIHYIRSGRWDIATIQSGAGNVLVYLPFCFNHCELAWSSPLFRRTLERLGETHRVVQYDSRGHGLSTRGLPDDLSFEDFVADLEAVIDSLSVRKVVLFACLQFAKVAMRYAALHPDRVEALVLWNPFSRLPGSTVSGSGAFLAIHNFAYLVQVTVATAFPQDEPGVQQNILANAIVRDDFIKLLTVLNAEDLELDLPRIRAPTLVLATRSTAWAFATEEASKHIAASIPNARLRLFDGVGGGLYSLTDERLAALDVVEAFLGEARTATTPQPAAGSDAQLSDREIEVLRLVATGKSNAQIADELVISPRTVDRHVANILQKTGATNRTQAATFAMEHGLT